VATEVATGEFFVLQPRSLNMPLSRRANCNFSIQKFHKKVWYSINCVILCLIFDDIFENFTY